MGTKRPSVIRPGAADLRRTWGQLLLVTIATRFAVTVLLLPILALVLRLSMAIRGEGVLSDAEIAGFFLSPFGLAILIVVAGFWIGVAFIEGAALMTVGHAAADGRRVGWFAALRFVGSKLPTILRLGSHLLARFLLYAAPFLIVVLVVVKALLGDHDINYYLFHRPPKFYWALAIVLPLLAIMVLLLAYKVISWLMALPAVLFENLKPEAAIKDSIADSKGYRWQLARLLVCWVLLGAIMGGVVNFAISFLGRGAISLAGESLGMLAFTIGAVGVIAIVLNALVSFLLAALFALVAVRLYRECSGPGELPPLDGESALGEAGRIHIEKKKFFFGAVGIAFVAAVLSHVILSRMNTEDEVIIIAHRGSAATAPENTMAAVRDALEAGADVVEIDVQETADGEVVVFHDSDFMKIAGEPLKIWDARRADLDRIDIGSWFDPKFAGERTPTLDQVLAECKGRAVVNIELKYYGHDVKLEERVVEIVERHDMADEVVVMSLKSDKVAKIKAMRPDWTYGLLTSFQLGDIGRFDVDFLGVNAHSTKRSFVRRAKGEGFDFYVWTVNDPFQMSAMISRGVDGLITDEPALARKVLEFRAGLSPIERLLVAIGAEVGNLSVTNIKPTREKYVSKKPLPSSDDPRS